MIVNRSELHAYLESNPEKRVYVTEVVSGTSHLATAGEHCEISLPSIGREPGDYSVYFTDTQVEIVLYGESATTVKATITNEVVEDVKRWMLGEQIAYQLRKLHGAAKQMVSHYNTVSGQDIQHRVDVYFLKHLDFRQDEKGVVVIVPRSRGIDPRDAIRDDPNIIKGYVYSSNTENIKWETVQAWRYHYQDCASHLLNFSSPLKDWVDLL